MKGPRPQGACPSKRNKRLDSGLRRIRLAGLGGEDELRRRWAEKSGTMKKTTAFRKLIHDAQILQLPCCHDGLSAKVLQQAGFKAIAAAGYGLAGSLLGMPDIGVLTGSDWGKGVNLVRP